MIVGHRTIKGRRQFLVRWKGYSNASDSWENEKDLNCPKLIEEFLVNEKESKEIKPAKTKATKTDKSKKARVSSKKQTEHGTLSFIGFVCTIIFITYVFSRKRFFSRRAGYHRGSER